MKGIMFVEELFNKVLARQKTETRRIMNPQPEIHDHSIYVEADWKDEKPQYYNMESNQFACKFCGHGVQMNGKSIFKSKYKVGETVYLKEPYYDFGENVSDRYIYKFDKERYVNYVLWKNKMFMPERSARHFIKITDVRCERLHNISEKSAIAEGIESWIEERMVSKPTHYKVYYQKCKPQDLCSYTPDPIDSYSTLWQKINGEKSWDENPFVFVYEFKLLKK